VGKNLGKNLKKIEESLVMTMKQSHTTNQQYSRISFACFPQHCFRGHAAIDFVTGDNFVAKT
jgi:hypothetical protein